MTCFDQMTLNSIYFKYSGENRPGAIGYLPEELRTGEGLLERLLGAFGPVTEQNFAVAFKWGETELVATKGNTGGNNVAPITVTTRFRLASVTKQLVARCVIELEKAGKLSLDDRLTDFFDGLPKGYKKITVKMLLNHTSGLLDYEDMPWNMPERQVLDIDVEGYLKTLDTFYFEPGTAYRYSNTGYVILGLIIEKASCLSIPDAMKKYVFDPVGMDGTCVNIEGKTQIPERAYGYERRNGLVLPHDQSRFSATIGDGVYSTLTDIMKWEDNLSVSEKALSGTMFKDVLLPDGSLTGYGMGIRLRKVKNVKLRTHTGITVGFNSAVAYSPDVPFRAAFLTNLSVDDPAPFIDAAIEIVWGRQ